MRTGGRIAGFMFKSAVGALAIAGALSLAACGGGNNRTATVTSAAPTASTPGAQTPTPPPVNAVASATVPGGGAQTAVPTTPPGVRACAPSDVTARVAEQGATGSLAGSIIITNASATDCTLSPPAGAVVPRVVIADAKGTVLVTGSAAAAAAGTTVLLKPGEKAFVVYVWSNWCGAAPAAPLHVTVSAPRADIVATLAGGSTAAATPRCDDSSAPSILSVGALRHDQAP
ncbi:MAG: DUF4232 domain-containing protein [Dehalococcoidia bacterium]